MREFNRLCMNGKSQLKSFPGATARQLNHYIVPTLEEEDKPDVVIIHFGINDLLKKEGKQSEEEIDNTAKEIAKEITNIGLRCKEYGVKNIFLSGIAYSAKVNINLIRKLNRQLECYCNDLCFEYINNENIRRHDLWKDGIHLQNSGIKIIVDNFLSNLHYYFRSRIQDQDIT